jgi:hypothetical protein
MSIYIYHYLYCGNCDLSLAGPNDLMALCSQCESLMLRLDKDFWKFFNKNAFQFKEKMNHPSAPTAGADTLAGNISIGLNSGQRRFTHLNNWTQRTKMSQWGESPLHLACRTTIFCDKKL